MVAGNRLVVGAISALRDRGLRIPDDLSLVGCDDTELTSLHDPPIDIVNRDLLELGQTAAELLLDRLRHPAAPPGASRFRRRSCPARAPRPYTG